MPRASRDVSFSKYSAQHSTLIKKGLFWRAKYKEKDLFHRNNEEKHNHEYYTFNFILQVNRNINIIINLLTLILYIKINAYILL